MFAFFGIFGIIMFVLKVQDMFFLNLSKKFLLNETIRVIILGRKWSWIFRGLATDDPR